MLRCACLSMLALGFATVASAAHADVLSDLRATLMHLHAQAPFAGTLDVHSTENDGGSGKPKSTQAHVQVNVASDASGLHIGFAPELLNRSTHEAAVHAGNPDAPTPTLDLLGKLNPVSVQSVLDVAPVLLHKLDGATLSTQRDEVHNGRPTHLLMFDVPSGLASDDRGAIKHYEGRLSVWLGADGVPVALAESRDYKGRKFLISFEMSTGMTATLQRIGTRLMAVSQRVENKGSGLGQSSDSVIETTLASVAKVLP